MGISNFLGLFGLLSLPVIVILYMFRPKHRLKEVPSIFLWQEIMEDLSHAKKFEKLRKTLLFLLDIAIAILITMLLMGIFFNRSKDVDHHILVIKNSFSMQSEDIKPSRFEKAKGLATEYIDKLDDSTEVSIIVAKDNPEILAKRELYKKTAKNKVKAIPANLGQVDLQKLNDLIIDLKNKEDAKVVYFTDEAFSYAENVLIKENSDNLAITNMASKRTKDAIHTAVTVENQSDVEKNAQVSLYDNDLYLTTKTIKIPAKTSEILFFENINKNISVLKAIVDNQDINSLDNTYYDITKIEKIRKIALISDGHFFLERFLSLDKNIEVFKLSPSEYQNLSNYDAYIFDSFVPEILPQDGNILLLDPSSDKNQDLIKANGYLKNPSFTVDNHPINQFIKNNNFSIGLSQSYDKTPDRKGIYSADDNLLAFSTQNGLQKIFVFGFDFRYTDLPLKADFPILMNNIIANILDEKMTEHYKYSINDNIKIYLKPSSTSAEIISPSGRKFPCSTENTSFYFTDAKELGLYKIRQESKHQEQLMETSSHFAINPKGIREDKDIEFKTENAEIIDFKSKEDMDKILATILLILLLVELYIRIRKYPLKHKSLLALRLVILIFVILSYFNPSLAFSSKYTDTIFVADFSESMQEKEGKINDFIGESLKNAGSTDLYGLVSFADGGWIESNLREEHDFNDMQRPKLNLDSSNIVSGIEKAEFLFNEEDKKRIVLLTDGRENAGNLIKKLGEIKHKKISLDVVKMGEHEFKEVEIEDLKLPLTAKKGQSIKIDVSISSNVETPCKIYLYNRNDLVEKKDVLLENGKQNFIFYSKLSQTGILEYRVEIIPEIDTYTENNKLSSFVNVDGKMKMLIVENGHAGENYARIFEDYDVDLIEESAAPRDLESILYYDAFLLADCDYEKLGKDFIENVAHLVKNQAKSLIVSGGEHSYQLGSYAGTKLEEILPVEMKVKDKEKKENIAMVLVIDRSGSMGGGEYGVSKMSLAKEAAIRASEVLEEKDFLAVIAFDSTPYWVVDLEHITDKELYAGKISAIKPLGGTSIQPALKQAIDALEKNDAALKHIILLTDGMAEQDGYGRFISAMKENNISLSCVAVGDSADTKLLSYLANNGNGRYYKSNVFTDIPTIFAKETVLAGKKYLNNVTFYPEIKSTRAIFNGIDAMPKLHGYVACTEKPQAHVILTSKDNDPILASYHYGLGKTLAFTSDMHGLWSKDFLAWQDNKKFWHNILSELLNQNLSSKIEFSSEYKDNLSILRLEFNEKSKIKDKEIPCSILDSEGKTREIKFKLKSPYVYEAKVKSEKEGLHLITSSIPMNGKMENFNSAFIVPYSEEYRFFGKNRISEEDITSITGGRIISNPKEVFTGKVEDVNTSYNLTKLLLVLALLLFLVELTFRMTNLAVKIKVKSKQNKVKIKETVHVITKNDSTIKNNDTSTSKRQAKKIWLGNKDKKTNKSSSSHVDELLK